MSKFKSKQTKDDRRNISRSQSEGTVKKPFDKAKWRERKYSNKAKINRFEEIRRKTVLREYYKEVKKSGTVPGNSQTPGSSTKVHKDGSQKRSLKPHELARREAERLQQEKETKRLEKEQAIKERKAALAKYKDKKKDRFSKLSKKTQKGQPVMAGRMELLLEKIQRGM